MVNYIVKDKTIIFSPYFNEEIEHGLLEKYSNVIFSNYKLNEDLFECYEMNDFKDFKYTCSQFNQQVNLPPNLTYLTFGFCFNQQVNLPPNLTHLTFDTCFNQQVNLPPNLTHLTFGFWFNQQVNFPPNLTHLTFGRYFNQQVNLPQNLTHLTFGYDFNQQVNLPFSIEYLNINSNNVNIIDYLPDSVEEFVLDRNFNLELNNLPSSIKKLVIKNKNYSHELNCLPNNLEYLELPPGYNKEIKKYPKQLKTIKCYSNYEYINKINGFEIETYD